MLSPSTTSIATSPSASAAAVSIDCVRRARRSFFITSRSITTSIVCLNFLSRSGMPSSSRNSCPSAVTRIQEAQVVVDLGDRSDGRARVARGRLLVDRDRRAQAVDVVDVRLLHHLEELPRVGRERLDVAALPLGVDRVEGKARLPGPGKAGDADQAVPRQADGDVLQVVLAGAVDDKSFGSHEIAAIVSTERML